MDYIIENILERFGYKLIDYEKKQKIFKCITDNGVKEIKEANLCKEKIMQDYLIREYLLKETNINTIRLNVDKTNNCPYIEIGSRVFTLNDYKETRECNFDTKDDLILAVKNLANLHNALQGINIKFENGNLDNIKQKLSYDEITFLNKNFGMLKENYIKRKESLTKNLKKISKKIEQDEFDKLYLKCLNTFVEDATLAIEILEKSNYNDLIANVAMNQSICHNDYAFGNVTFDDENSIVVIGFENANYDTRMYDLANVIKRRMRRCNWDFEETKMIIQNYIEISNITKDELVVLYAMLVFPQKFWRIINQHYNGIKIFNNDGDLQSLNREIKEEEYHKQFISEFQKYYL